MLIRNLAPGENLFVLPRYENSSDYTYILQRANDGKLFSMIFNQDGVPIAAGEIDEGNLRSYNNGQVAYAYDYALDIANIENQVAARNEALDDARHTHINITLHMGGYCSFQNLPETLQLLLLPKPFSSCIPLQ